MREIPIDDDGTPLLQLLQQVVFEKNMFSKFTATEILINSLEKKVAEKTKALEIKKFIEKNVYEVDKPTEKRTFLRKLSLISTIQENTETAIEYFGKDHITHEEFYYDPKINAKITAINRVLNNFIGTLIKELSKTTDIKIDEYLIEEESLEK